jgi:hypothetical protein
MNMEDDRILEFERALWIGEEDIYRRCVSNECLLVVPEEPFLLRGEQAIVSVENSPRWTHVDLFDLEVIRPQEGLIVIAYRAEACRSDEKYEAFCTSTYQRVGKDDWRVVQHQQTVPQLG